MSEDWTPLLDHWDRHEKHIAEVTARAQEDDSAEVQEIIWPSELYFGEEEKEEVQRFINLRLNELMNISQHQPVTVEHIGGYLYRTLLAGLLWEKERIG